MNTPLYTGISGQSVAFHLVKASDPTQDATGLLPANVVLKWRKPGGAFVTIVLTNGVNWIEKGLGDYQYMPTLGDVDTAGVGELDIRPAGGADFFAIQPELTFLAPSADVSALAASVTTIMNRLGIPQVTLADDIAVAVAAAVAANNKLVAAITAPSPFSGALLGNPVLGKSADLFNLDLTAATMVAQGVRPLVIGDDWSYRFQVRDQNDDAMDLTNVGIVWSILGGTNFTRTKDALIPTTNIKQLAIDADQTQESVDVNGKPTGRGWVTVRTSGPDAAPLGLVVGQARALHIVLTFGAPTGVVTYGRGRIDVLPA